MKSFKALILVSFLMGSVSMAADAEKSASETSDVSKNPLTGTVTQTKKSKHKVKNKDGRASEVEVTDKVKTKKNGEVQKNVKVESDAKPGN